MARRSHPSDGARGFAYLWLLFTVAFMGVGLVVVAEVHAVAQQRDKERELLAIGHQFREALRRYQERSGPLPGQLPGQLPQGGAVVGVTGGVTGLPTTAGTPLGGGAGARPYPASLDELLQDPRTPGITRHLRQVFVDPMTGKAEWGLVRVGGRIVGIHSLSQRQPIKQAGFEDQDMAFAGKERYRDWVFTYPAHLMASLPSDGGGANVGSGMSGANGANGAPGVAAPGQPGLFGQGGLGTSGTTKGGR
ncbi:MAG: type II secretion system protein [Proteobacteria bacterium]|uniref:type II secretion system protein n=1 Tax=Aquabacterium sp. TaxID=1872578 RepID=UPI0035C6D89C|nr:type II secretion system protein [Pseudomonadota bacterium]